VGSFRQIEANRRNARKSTGPTSEEGKQRSRCNTVRHGLTAETVIGALEDAEDYKAFEDSLTAADARQVEDAFQAKLRTLDGAAEVSDQPARGGAPCKRAAARSLPLGGGSDPVIAAYHCHCTIGEKMSPSMRERMLAGSIALPIGSMSNLPVSSLVIPVLYHLSGLGLVPRLAVPHLN
jgi:hypothetical protein